MTHKFTNAMQTDFLTLNTADKILNTVDSTIKNLVFGPFLGKNLNAN